MTLKFSNLMHVHSGATILGKLGKHLKTLLLP